MNNKIEILKNGNLGRKKEKKVFFPKGRLVDEKAESEIKDLRSEEHTSELQSLA